jgi:hypothetical protein
MTVREFVTARAEYRNKLLYADAGFLAMEDDLEHLIDTVFRATFQDILWCLAVLLPNTPASRDWGLVSQFIGLCRHVLAELR